MSIALGEAWRRLDVGAPPGDSLYARAALPDVSPRLQCGIDAGRKRHLLIRLDVVDADYHDNQSRGLIVRTRELAIHGQAPGRYLDVECGDAAGHEIFDMLATDLAEDLAKPDSRPGDSVRRVLGRWRRFWAHLPLPLLSREEQLGLFAEVWFLDVWLRPRIGSVDAIDRWHGPTGARHDFSWSKKAVEAKATTSSRGHIFRINGLDQLVPPDGGDLYLFGMRLQEDSGASNSLPSLVARTRSALAAEPDAQGQFETLLALAGYSSAYDDEYDKLRLIVREERLFAVKADFPKLTPHEIAGVISPAIEHVEYHLNLNGFDHLSVVGDADIHSALAS